MYYYSTHRQAEEVGLQQAVIESLATDHGLYMPSRIPTLPGSFLDNIGKLSFHEIALTVAFAFFGEDIEAQTLQTIVEETLSFDTPVVTLSENVYSLELFHGPTLAFKDVGARFMARLLGYFIRRKGLKAVNVLVATSGDTGSAVANGFLGVEGIHVFILYPKGKVSPIQESQFATLGQNITALEIDGTFDDCQAMVKAFLGDSTINKNINFASANSINIARLLPQTFYYFHACAQLMRQGIRRPIVYSVPSGNFGNLTAGLIAYKMGLPVRRFIAANNVNDVFLRYLATDIYRPRPSIQTLANAMDVGDPSNFARIIDLFQHDYETISSLISGFRCSDADIRQTVRACYESTGYLLDPHGACGYLALTSHLQEGETGVFLETAHPAKFKDVIEPIIEKDIPLPARLQAFMKNEKQSVEMYNNFKWVRSYLLRKGLR